MKQQITPIIMLAGFLLIIQANLMSQSVKSPKYEKMMLHNEVPDDPYLEHPGRTLFTSDAYTYKSSTVFTTQVNVNENGQNIVGDAANEPSIGVNPLNPAEMVIGWRQFDNISSNFRQAGYGFTIDGGQTWNFPGVINPGVFRSDPVLEYDASGTLFYNSLTSNAGVYTCKVFKSADGGESWDDGTEARGGDKQWMEIDKSGGIGHGNIYSFWTTYYSSCYPGDFTRSTDAGAFYEDCTTVEGEPYWGTMAIGPSGELYVAGAGVWGGLVVTKSTNAQDPGSMVMWDYDIPVDLDGEVSYGATVNPGGLLGQVIIDVDRSGGPGHGNVYILAAVQRNSNNDPGDIMFTKSTNGGLSWSSPLRVNKDISISNTQWFGTMSVAPNGRIDAVWLDTRDAPVNTPRMSALYYSYSIDFGNTWSTNERVSEVFDPHLGWPNQQKMGDYFDMYSDNQGAHVAWAGTLNGEQDVYYSHIIPDITGTGHIGNTDYLALSCYPNPFSGHTTIRYAVSKKSHVKLTVLDIYGNELERLADQNQDAGNFSLSFASDKLGTGIYFCRLESGNLSKTIKMMIFRK